MGAPEIILETALVPGRPDRRPAAPGLLEVYAFLGLASFAVARFVPVLEWFHYTCPFLALTGLPCATCGMTHAFVLLAHGDVAGALSWSPAGAALAAGAWIFGAADLVRAALGWQVPAVPPRALRRAAIAAVAALLVNWAWLVVHGLGP